MNKKIAIITGASGGIGKEFVRLLTNEDIDEIWAIARNEQKLEYLKNNFGNKIIIIPKDLTKLSEIYDIQKKLIKENPTISYLVNNAGIAKMGLYSDFEIDEIQNTIQLNCNVIVALCTLCIPYMKKGSKILNISSASSFQPLPYLNLYSATKAFERNYSRALNFELKNKGITSTAVCPSWVDTDLLLKEINGKPIKFKGLVTPEKVAQKALIDAKKGKDMSVCTLYVKFQHVLLKIFPQKTTMKTWFFNIKNYI